MSRWIGTQAGEAITAWEMMWLIAGPPQLVEWEWVVGWRTEGHLAVGSYDFQCMRDGFKMRFRLVDDLWWRVPVLD